MHFEASLSLCITMERNLVFDWLKRVNQGAGKFLRAVMAFSVSSKLIIIQWTGGAWAVYLTGHSLRPLEKRERGSMCGLVNLNLDIIPGTSRIEDCHFGHEQRPLATVVHFTMRWD